MKKLLLAFSVFAGVSGLRLLWTGLGGRSRWEINLAALSSRLGLPVTPDGLAINATQHGRRVRVFLEESSGRHVPAMSSIEVQPQTASDFGLLLTPESVVTKTLKLVGWTETKLHDAAFDAAWFVRTNDPQFLASALTDELRAELIAERSSGWISRFRIEVGRVQYSIHGTLADADVVAGLERQLPLLHRLADVVEAHAVWCATESGSEPRTDPGLHRA
jgi:hypothetical protein